MTTAIQVNRPVPIKNVAAFSTLVAKVVERPLHLPGMACFSAPSGYGKSRAAAFGANKYRGRYVECDQYTTAKSLLVMILKELGVAQPRGSVPELIEEAILRLAADIRRPLIVDEAHHIAHKRFVDLLRTLHDKSGAPVILIGEETLPKQLESFERVHNRMLAWVQARPLDAEDFGMLAKSLYPSVILGADLAEHILHTMKGNTRRVIVNLDEVAQRAKKLGIDQISLAQFLEQGPVIGRDAPNARAI
jgi:DNA transposition AAA+ family ATPase